jgi:phosphonate C-P lyase system protein PhnH
MTNRPVYPAQETRTRRAFSALMWAHSHPGRTQVLSPRDLTGDSRYSVFLTIAETMLDLETTYFTSDPGLAAQLYYTTGARALPANRAIYHFYPTVSANDLDHIESASRGNPLYPDHSATLCLGCARGSMNSRFAQTAITLQRGNRHLSFSFSGIPPAIWALREQRNVDPTGWDIFLIDADGKLIYIPRSINIQIERLGDSSSPAANAGIW